MRARESDLVGIERSFCESDAVEVDAEQDREYAEALAADQARDRASNTPPVRGPDETATAQHIVHDAVAQADDDAASKLNPREAAAAAALKRLEIARAAEAAQAGTDPFLPAAAAGGAIDDVAGESKQERQASHDDATVQGEAGVDVPVPEEGATAAVSTKTMRGTPKCVICLEHAPVPSVEEGGGGEGSGEEGGAGVERGEGDSGLWCAAGVHFLCRECMEGHVKNQCSFDSR